MEIRKNINITLKDYFLFNLGLVKKTIITYVILLVFVCIAFNGIANGFTLNSLDFWLDTLVFYLVGLVFLFLYFGVIVYFASKKAYIPNKKYYENIELVINEEGIYQYSSGAESKLEYDKITKAKESKLSLVLLVNARQGILIPKKGFNEEELIEIRKLLKIN